MQNTTLCFPLHLHTNKKRIIQKDKTRVRATFYFIEDNITTREQINSTVDWQHIYYNYKLPRNIPPGLITRIHMNKFAGKCRRYMLAYMNQAKLSSDSPPSLTLEGIEKFQKSCKTHRNTADMDKGYITQIFVLSCSVKNGNREENT